jgi:hypothetical protein
MTGLGAKPQLPGGSTAPGGDQIGVLQQAKIDCLLHALRNEFATQSGFVLEPGAGPGTSGADQIDQLPVDEGILRGGRCAHRDSGRRQLLLRAYST